jgi:hypothetical protein
MRLLSRPKIVAALALAAVAGPLLAPGGAVAAPPTVTFNGGCGLLGVAASSRPSTSSVRIAANSSVNFVNHLSDSAQLLINGASEATIKPDYQVEVSFHASATVSLVPSCLLGSGAAGSVSIRVSAPSGGGDVPSVPATVAPTTQLGAPSARASVTISPSGQPSASPSGSAASRSATPQRTDPSTPAAALAPPVGPSGSAALVAIGATSPATSGHHGPDRLLAVIAAVCLIGVSIALIRAIVAQRAIRMVTA